MENTFKLWAAEKKVKDSDLVFAKALKTAAQQDLFFQLAGHLASLRPSFSEGLTVLELITELILINPATDLKAHASSLATWTQHLKQLRYPMATILDAATKAKLEALPWPQGSKVKFERRGDRAGVEIKFFVSSSVDITKLQASLERVQTGLAK